MLKIDQFTPHLRAVKASVGTDGIVTVFQRSQKTRSDERCQDSDEVKKALFASQLSAADQAIYERYRHNQQRSIADFYPIYTVEPSELDELEIQKISHSYDYVFFDLGGRFDESIVPFADLVLVPFTTQNIDVMASLEYCLTLADHVQQGHLSDSTQFHCFWNKYKFPRDGVPFSEKSGTH